MDLLCDESGNFWPMDVLASYFWKIGRFGQFFEGINIKQLAKTTFLINICKTSMFINLKLYINRKANRTRCNNLTRKLVMISSVNIDKKHCYRPQVLY